MTNAVAKLEQRERAREDVESCRRQLLIAYRHMSTCKPADWQAARVGARFMRAALANALEHAYSVGAISKPCREQARRWAAA